MTTQIFDSVAAIDADRWNALVEPGNPFMRHEFLLALEETGCIGSSLAWQPKFVIASEAGNYLGAIAAFARSDSYGEYIFDWAWANAYAEARLPYYPKITAAAPFTPASGRRLLMADPKDEVTLKTLVTALEDSAHDLNTSGIHLLCTTRNEQKQLSQFGFMPRLTHQYHRQEVHR